ncbi:MAG: hypothetical protein JXR30_01445 [Alphaproteobacteria bacterium]|nr:hypothetical protein [Alphaproteobacteria bacterium]
MKRILTFLFCVISSQGFALFDAQLQLSFPEVKSTAFPQRRIRTQSRQASEFYLDVQPAPISSVSRFEKDLLPEPIVQEDSFVVPQELTSDERLEPKHPNLAYENKHVKVLPQNPEDIKMEFEKTVVAQNKYISMMEDPTSEDDFDNLFDEPLPGQIDESDFDDAPLVDVSEQESEEKEEVDFDTLFDEPVVKEESVDAFDTPSLSEEVDAFSEESSVSTEESSSDETMIKVLQMRIGFERQSAALSAKNVHLISSFSQVVQNNPLNAVEVSVGNQAMQDPAKKELAAKRFALISRVLKDNGLTEERIRPVLTQRDENSFALKIVNKDHRDAMIIQDDDLSDLIQTRSIPIQTW